MFTLMLCPQSNSRSAKGADFVSVADKDTAMHLPLPRTPPITRPIYTVVTSHSPSSTTPSDQSPPVITFQRGISDPPLITPSVVRPDERVGVVHDSDDGHRHPQCGVFHFNVVAQIQQVRVEKEENMQAVVMAGYADRYIII